MVQLRRFRGRTIYRTDRQKTCLSPFPDPGAGSRLGGVTAVFLGRIGPESCLPGFGGRFIHRTEELDSRAVRIGDEYKS